LNYALKQCEKILRICPP